VGSANEVEEEAGIAHFLEHLFFKGTTTRNVHQLMDAIENKGGHLNAFTSREYTCLYVKMLDEYLHIGVEILADLVKNAVFRDLEKERNVILEEIAAIEDTPDEYVFDLLSEHHWRNHPLGRSVSGGAESVSKLSLEQVRAFFQTWYQPENLIISVAGNFDPERVFAQIEQEFAALPSRPAPLGLTMPAFQGGPRLFERDIAQDHVCIAFPGPKLGTPERYVCDLTSGVLGGGSTSRLFERIREDEGLAYSIYTFNAYHTPTGMIGVSATVAPQNLDRTLELTFDALRELREEPVGPDEMATNRAQIKGGILMSLESTSARMSRMAKSMMYYGRIIPLAEIIENVEAVTPERIREFACATFLPEQCALVILGPPKDAAVREFTL
jgi:predicted Zn-dependent peptidase